MKGLTLNVTKKFLCHNAHFKGKRNPAASWVETVFPLINNQSNTV
jgi:hypothetical protein